MLSSKERQKFDRKFAALWSIDPNAVVAANDRHTLSIVDVKIGGALRIGGEVFVVTKLATYTETNDKYTKNKDYVATELVLSSLRSGEIRYLEWEDDDEVAISLVERKLNKVELNQRLRDDEGEAFDVDEDIDEACEYKWSVVFEGVEYPYDDDWPCRYESSDGRSYKAYIYEFGSDDVGWLTIEAWKDGDDWEYEGYLSETLDSSSVEIISLSS